MEKGSTKLTEVARSVQLLKIEGFSLTSTMSETDHIKSGWNVNGYDWEVRLYPSEALGILASSYRYVLLKLLLLSEARVDNVRASLTCRLVHPRGKREPSQERSVSNMFSLSQASSPEVSIALISRQDVPGSGYLLKDSLTVECTVTVLKERKDIIFTSMKDVSLQTPPSDMPQHFGKLLQSQMGADVTFTVSGETFAAHKNILAARSPVFMAEFFGHMKETRSWRVNKVMDIEAPVFSAMLHFIYTDTVPELDLSGEEVMVMAQHLLAAADRYGLDRLKLICEGKLSGGISVDTAAETLALAEQRNCSLLKAKCVEFVTASPEKLDAVLATEGYKHLVASCPLVLTELLKAARGRNN
ncbi:hypothetical protein PR202_gb28171 [Eleusine coracana subsp. coracana]|uniref:BTB domain-containing protein n=1 Tax=Eleusine coracana subsp. coracana TaxID=191504 RepID=A0AAV5FVP0_ELECO|nr:hypothetical protein QOZ80_6AG0547710 [Eleusine coracana subsp. coracana]GJN39077.1 hypothetical protein PR202_gb28171 [Eleusine coracana subsp. coracana]